MDLVEVFGYTWRYWDFRSDQYMDGDSIAMKVLVTQEGLRLKEEEGRKHGSKDYQLGRSWKVPSESVDENGIYHPERRKVGFQSQVGEILPF